MKQMADEKRLVNAEAIARKLKSAYCAECNVVRKVQCSACWVEDVLEMLEGDAVDAVEVVRCKDCKHFKPAHFKADDGTETPWDETFSFDDRSDGIYHGGRCRHDRNTAYGEKDMAYRKPDDFCSYGERREGE